MAVAQDITRGALGVPGMNYSTLLDRSVDFATYESVFNAAYPSERDRQVVFALVQMLWDRGEANGYAAHIAKDPLPGTPRHQVLLHPAFGDHQVANAAAEVMARTIGAATNSGFLAAGRHWSAKDPGWGLPRFTGSTAGSALVYWDSGSATPPNGNVPPTEDDTLAGHDPHSDPRDTKKAREQKSLFLRPGGTVVDVCAGAPCLGKPLARELGHRALRLSARADTPHGVSRSLRADKPGLAGACLPGPAGGRTPSSAAAYGTPVVRPVSRTRPQRGTTRRSRGGSGQAPTGPSTRSR